MSEIIFEKNLKHISGFKFVPKGWNISLVKDIFELGRGRVISQNEIDSKPGSYPVYSSQSVNDGIMGKIDSFDFEGEFLTWTTDGAYAGTIFHRNGKFNCTNVCGTLKAKNQSIFPKFFHYQLGRISKNYVSYVGNPKLMNEVMGNIAIAYPPLIHQIKIAKILSTVDNVIEKTQAAIEKYKAIKQGMLKDLFTRGIDIKTGKLRPKYEDAPELYKPSPLGFIPKEWEVEKFENICFMKSGEGITSISIREKDDFPVYGGNGLRGYTSNFTHNGDFIIIGRQGALCGNVIRVSGKFFASEHAVVVKMSEKLNVDWLYQKLVFMELNKYSEASAQPGLSVNKILKLEIAFPKFEEQIIIALRLNSIDTKIQSEEKYLQKLQQLKLGLMNDLLTGKKEVKAEEEN